MRIKCVVVIGASTRVFFPMNGLSRQIRERNVNCDSDRTRAMFFYPPIDLDVIILTWILKVRICEANSPSPGIDLTP